MSGWIGGGFDHAGFRVTDRAVGVTTFRQVYYAILVASEGATGAAAGRAIMDVALLAGENGERDGIDGTIDLA